MPSVDKSDDLLNDAASISATNTFKSRTKKLLGLCVPRMRKVTTLSLLSELRAWGKQHQVMTVSEKKLGIDHYVFHEMIQKTPITYLEFGVFTGASMRFWTSLSSAEESRFYGFDSFEGLPADWEKFIGSMKKEHFDLQGKMPSFDDDRVTLIKGWFQDTLGDFLKSFEPRHQLVVNIDSDLYASALYVLTMLDSSMPPATIVLFDDFSSVGNDFRALRDYCAAYQRTYEVLGAAGPYYNRVAIRLTN